MCVLCHLSKSQFPIFRIGVIIFMFSKVIKKDDV